MTIIHKTIVKTECKDGYHRFTIKLKCGHNHCERCGVCQCINGCNEKISIKKRKKILSAGVGK